MKMVIQRVKKAEVRVEKKIVGKIGLGMLVLLGIGKEDTEAEANYLINKIVRLRMFEDSDGKMNCSAIEMGVEFLVVSQFTLYGSCSKGRRPSFDKAAPPKEAEMLYVYFVEQLKKKNVKVETGQFQAMMEVDLINDGPVTFVLETERSK